MKTLNLVKYNNRKLYSKEHKSYISLADVIYEFERGTQVVVRDHKSGHDRTKQVLTEILVKLTPDLNTAALESFLRSSLEKKVRI